MNPEFIKIKYTRGEFPRNYYAPANKAAWYLSRFSDKKYFTQIDLIYLIKAGLNPLVIEGEKNEEVK